MKNEFTKIMAQQSDEDLIRILSVDKQKYNPESIEAAEKEFEKRNLDQSKFEEIKEKNTARKSNQQNVNKNVASSFTRFLNFIVDLICLNIVFLVLVFIFGMFFTINLENEGISTLPGLLLFIASIVLYYSVMEIKFQKTEGKFLIKN